MATITKRGSTWRVRVRRAGQPQASKTFDTRAEAERWGDAEDERVDNPAPVVQPTPVAGMSVAQLFDRYAREVSPSKGGWRWEVIRLRKLARSFSGPAASLDGATLAEWRDRRLQEVSPSSVNRELILLGSVFTRAIKEWRLPLVANPVHQIMLPRKNPSRRRRVTDIERQAICERLGWAGTEGPRTRLQWVAWVFSFAVETAMRKGEILGMTWEHVHLERRFVHLPKTKNGHARNVPLSSRALALFALLTPREGRVAGVTSGTLDNYFRRAVAAAGISDMHFHDSRREAATRAAKKLRNVAELARFTGHRDLRSLMVYYEPDPTEMAGMLD